MRNRGPKGPVTISLKAGIRTLYRMEDLAPGGTVAPGTDTVTASWTAADGEERLFVLGPEPYQLMNIIYNYF